MPSMDIRLAWVTRVKVEVLGGHLQAYINLQPTLTTLRLCNRFGKGDMAFIARLPVELVTQVEDILMRQERTETWKAWTEDYRCFQALCTPTDHSETEELEEIYREIFVDEFVDSDHETVRPKRKLTLSDIKKLDETLHDFDNGYEGWRASHSDRKVRWYEKAGKPEYSSRGFFTQHKDLLLKHFGLEVWIAHKQHTQKRKGQWDDGSLLRCTTAYLTLPVSESASKEWDVDYKDENWSGRSRMPTEVGYAFSLADPIKPPRKSLRRFPRAIKMLGLKTMAPKDTLDLIADGGDVEDRESGDEGPSEEYKGVSRGWPYLRLLVVNRDETTDQY
ncbi:hypothetical protein LTR85_010942 [Meristemomyces frigidus]|nr:hypothetical protein LTR85_010942 [Meristemomyces frigidus]